MDKVTDMKEIKTYLNNVRMIDREINAKQEVVDSIRSQIQSVKISHVKDVNVQESLRNTTEDRIARYIDIQDEVNEMIDCLLDSKAKLLKEINRMDDGIHKTILIRRYVMNQSWEEIAELLSYTKQHITRLHGTALQQFYSYNAKKL